MNITDPADTQWHELWPIFCREYHLSTWEDNGDGVLSPCDRIDMYEKPDGEVRPYHVENVTITLLVAPPKNVVVDENGLYSPQSPLQGAPKSMYIELEGGYDPTILMAPNCTYWHEIYPKFCMEYHLTDWMDGGNPNGELGFCDHVLLTPEVCSGPRTCLLDEDFSGGFPPSGWATDDWVQWSSNWAGGASPEALLYWEFISGNSAYLNSKPVDTTGMLILALEFKSFIDDYCCSEGSPDPDCSSACPSYTCKVYSRAESFHSWTDVTPWGNPITGNVPANTYCIDISSYIGSATQVRFEFAGNNYAIDGWLVDDVRICYLEPTWWHVEDVAIDIIVTPEPPPVGGEAYPVNKASLLAPWIAVGVVLAGGAQSAMS